MATLAKLLQVDMGLPDMAKRLAAAGRGKDSILAHINPKEMALLKKHGGSGKTNPRTGIMEFDDDYSTFEPTTTDYGAFGESPTTEVSQTQNVRSDSPPVTNVQTGKPEAAVPLYDSRGNALDSSSTPAYDQKAPYASYTGPDGAARSPVQPAPSATGEEEKPSYAKRFANFISPVTQGAETLTKALDPLTPYAKFGTQAFGIYQANKAANETREQSARNEAEIRALADPYRKQAQLMQEQGQKMLAAGQSGQLTPQQQQDLETRRAVALQQQAAAGVSGGTAQQQVEADIQRTAQQYAQQNINQGLALMSQAQSVTGAADRIIQEAIRTGYAGSQDAAKLASEFYNAIGFSLPQTQSKGPTTAGATNG